MKKIRENIWKENEYTYEASYGFVPNLMTYLHEEGSESESSDESSEASTETSSKSFSEKNLRPCMLVVPGGGYCMVVPPEGEAVAKEFYDRGMQAFVLTYTTDITFSVPLHKQPLNDISRAVRYIRKNAERFGIDPNRIVICGFSAGGHVCGSLGVHYKDVTDPDPELQKISNRPDAMFLCYPVITSGEFTHEYSMVALTGNDAEERNYFSLENYVTEDTPPTFLWQTVEDDLVPVENSMMFASACKKAGVPYAYYAFPFGWHGLSIHTDSWRHGDFGEDYTMEQVVKAVQAVQEGKGIRVSEQRCEELKAQFSAPPQGSGKPCPKFPDVARWPDLAMDFLSVQFGEKPERNF